MSKYIECDQCHRHIDRTRPGYTTLSEYEAYGATSGGGAPATWDFCSAECTFDYLGKQIGARIVTNPRPRARVAE